MAESVEIVSLEGGELKVPESLGKHREVVLALPLSRLLVKVVRVSAENLEDVEGFVTPVMKAMSPFPDEPLFVSCETLRETEDGRVVLALAIPEGSMDDVAGALDGANLSVTRIAPISFGRLPAILPQFAEAPLRRLLLVGSADCLSVFVLDGDLIVAIRAISPGGDVARELMLSMLEAEAFNGPKPLAETVLAGDMSAWPIPESSPFAKSVRTLENQGDEKAGLAMEGEISGRVDALPESWREVLGETRFKRKMTVFFSCAAVVFLVALSVLVGTPWIYSSRTARSKAGRTEQTRRYNAVKAKKDQVEAVKSISDRNRGGLESLRAVLASLMDRDPAKAISLERWDFTRNEKLALRGYSEGDDQKPILRLKEGLSAITLADISGDEDDSEEPFFTNVELKKNIQKNATRTQGARWEFEIECSFKPEDGGEF